MEKESLLISACLLGLDCKYDGGTNALSEKVIAGLKAKYYLVPVCPESYGGLPAPRLPSERVGDRVLAKDGTDVTVQYKKGAETALRLAKLFGCRTAILKERSPSCGHSVVYDGTFTHTLVPGDGVAAELLMRNGVTVLGEGDIAGLI
jgi:uncharacterized protein YbbK (DUF523 family)